MLFSVGIVPSELLSRETNLFSEDVSGCSRAFILLAFMLGFGGIFGGTWIMIERYIIPQVPSEEAWPGVAIFFQPILINGRYL